MQKRILIADDDAAILDVLTLILEDGGYEVIAAASERGVREAIGSHPDLILLDVRMSGVDGRDICRQLRSDASTRDIPIVLISASNSGEDVAHECGADAFIAKPFEMDELLNLVSRTLERRSAASADWDGERRCEPAASDQQQRYVTP